VIRARGENKILKNIDVKSRSPADVVSPLQRLRQVRRWSTTILYTSLGRLPTTWPATSRAEHDKAGRE